MDTAKLSVLKNPNPTLRQKSKAIDNLFDPQLQKLAKDMIITMKEGNGIGIAAPQVGQLVRMVVIETKDGPQVFINPEITKRSWRKDIDEEGCLSVPGVFGDVKRNVSVTMKALNLHGKNVEVSAQGLYARVIQHEIDHLDGILFIDRVKGHLREQRPGEKSPL